MLTFPLIPEDDDVINDVEPLSDGIDTLMDDVSDDTEKNKDDDVSDDTDTIMTILSMILIQ